MFGIFLLKYEFYLDYYVVQVVVLYFVVKFCVLVAIFFVALVLYW
jgi:hypothetical protein